VVNRPHILHAWTRDFIGARLLSLISNETGLGQLPIMLNPFADCQDEEKEGKKKKKTLCPNTLRPVPGLACVTWLLVVDDPCQPKLLTCTKCWTAEFFNALKFLLAVQHHY
jgi:hypothetical protein